MYTLLNINTISETSGSIATKFLITGVRKKGGSCIKVLDQIDSDLCFPWQADKSQVYNGVREPCSQFLSAFIILLRSDHLYSGRYKV